MTYDFKKQLVAPQNYYGRVLKDAHLALEYAVLDDAIPPPTQFSNHYELFLAQVNFFTQLPMDEDLKDDIYEHSILLGDIMIVKDELRRNALFDSNFDLSSDSQDLEQLLDLKHKFRKNTKDLSSRLSDNSSLERGIKMNLSSIYYLLN